MERTVRSDVQSTLPWKLFSAITAYPRLVAILGLLGIAAAASFLPRLEKDTRADAFIPADHPALVYRDQVKEVFGLQDPMVIAVVNDGPRGVFEPHTLELVEWLTRRVEEVDNVDPDRVTSLATESDVFGTADGMMVEPFFQDGFGDGPITQESADVVREAVMDFPLYVGSLVARDGTATLVVAEMVDESGAEQVYHDLMALADEAPLSGDEAIHVAGEGAVAGYLGSYIDQDAARLNPISALVVTLVLFLAFRTARATLLPNLVMVSALAGAIGLMAAFGVKFYVITNSLPVVLIGIAVADSIHILQQYYEELRRRPEIDRRELVIRTMVQMWRPVTLTTLTTMAGFLGIAAVSIMPPMMYFGLFGALGVGVAWVYSVTWLPAVLSVLPPRLSRALGGDARDGGKRSRSGRRDVATRAMGAFGRWVAAHPVAILLMAGGVMVAGGFGASRLLVEEARIDNFKQTVPIVVADTVINERFDGVHYLDIIIETPEPEDLFRPENLQRIERLQAFLETLPHVNGTTSIVDYLKQMNRAMNEDAPEAYRLPTDSDLIAQYFLLYSASGDPADFEEEIDYDYRLANVRASLDTGLYSVERQVVEATERYLEEELPAPGITAQTSGRVNVDYHWLQRLAASHFRSMVVAMVLVLAMAAVSFRSATAGVIAVVPVAVAVLVVYAVMGFVGIWLGIGTSMFAAIAIGLGVDFAVHTIERMIVLMRDRGLPFATAVEILFASTGRALFFNFAALSLGFGVLTLSSVPVLARFGSLVVITVAMSFLASMTVVPALAAVVRPAFLGFSREPALAPLAEEAE